MGTLSRLQDKIPNDMASPDRLQDQDKDVSQITIRMDTLKEALRKFKRGSAPGGDGARVEHLLELSGNLRSNNSNAFLQALLDQINAFI